ncbi:MAG: hypothetical protein ACI88H_001824 [Cocleimonas sp.]|jgi:hypothetical protein
MKPLQVSGTKMRFTLLKHPRLKAFLLLITLSTSLVSFHTAHAEVIIMPIERVIPTQPITKLEVIGMVKSILNGRVLSVKKQSTYTNPDCHHIKFLEDQGEFHMIQIGCFIDNIVQNQ